MDLQARLEMIARAAKERNPHGFQRAVSEAEEDDAASVSSSSSGSSGSSGRSSGSRREALTTSGQRCVVLEGVHLPPNHKHLLSFVTACE